LRAKLLLGSWSMGEDREAVACLYGSVNQDPFFFYGNAYSF